MKINIATAHLDLTPSFRLYIEKKLAPIEKLIARFDPASGAEIYVEVSRTTLHHKQGGIYLAALNLRLPKTTLRAEARAEDARAAVDVAKDVLAREIKKYKTKFLAARRS